MMDRHNASIEKSQVYFAEFTERPGGTLTINTIHPGGNLVHRHKPLKFDVVGERPATETVYPNQPNRLKSVVKLHRLKS